MTERERFEAAHKHLSLDMKQGAWGESLYAASHVDAMWAGWKARAVLDVAVSPGLVLVPVEPTNAMWDAAVIEDNRVEAAWPGQRPSCFQIWKAMLSAAPSAKETTCPN